MLISIVYDSGYGHTARVAQAVAAGVQEMKGADVRLMAVADGSVDWEALERSDAIIFGSPTYNGLISAKFKQFFEDSTKKAWVSQKWRNKIAAGFTNSGAQHGDKLNSLMSMVLFAAQHGMIWVGLDLMPGNNSSTGSPDDLNRLGSWLGVMTQSNNDAAPEIAPPASDLKTAQHLGLRVAETVRRFQPV
ncbi:flavodoxin family protein [Xylella fastidiosa subsp. fastidiosa]|jgi:multimeric flavodoxin WrbA|uniref:Tryptophan repressor binding protein n=2 Tax=Xylella fastidiosa TaxID=2371 RepID=Q87E96_XYLFT|nr:flavodoxin family protein [Xylella fastidiosa]ADN63414.1 flavodoxin/nitric oxide synthase [Xylella fastidiosa subsp. fastidiosa GB514]KAF0572162.1 NADPH-dependent FMN reductase [Xylella fastidiosa subsp. fastidiosa Mus-1]AAO28301.1 tryptophan repressor binding protein [Xylella fastidiosa Temecula1]ACB91864.1 flavodoxin/nitric oxide synthase [Xylella fastidiosa M23]EGO81457.1 Multimeric flavodoxin [Xylella fastidiosa EB92.1]